MTTVKMQPAENAWKPSVMRTKNTADETELLLQSMRSILNKYSAGRFHMMMLHVKSLHIDSQDKLTGVSRLIFEKAVVDDGNSQWYAIICRILSDIRVPAESKVCQHPAFLTFRKCIVDMCHTAFESQFYYRGKLAEMSVETDPEKRKELPSIIGETFRTSVGLMRFIGELYNEALLASATMHQCIKRLLNAGDDWSLECLSALLSSLGQGLEEKTRTNHNSLEPYFDKMRVIADKRGPGSVSGRVRCRLLDVIELRQCNWLPRPQSKEPKHLLRLFPTIEAQQQAKPFIGEPLPLAEPVANVDTKNVDVRLPCNSEKLDKDEILDEDEKLDEDEILDEDEKLDEDEEFDEAPAPAPATPELTEKEESELLEKLDDQLGVVSDFVMDTVESLLISMGVLEEKISARDEIIARIAGRLNQLEAEQSGGSKNVDVANVVAAQGEDVEENSARDGVGSRGQRAAQGHGSGVPQSTAFFSSGKKRILNKSLVIALIIVITSLAIQAVHALVWSLD